MIYAVANLHGNYTKFKELLKLISFKDSDIMYVLGDVVDFGEESMELVGDLSVRYNVYPIVGEHDYTAVKMLSGFEKMLKSGENPDKKFIAKMTEWMQDGGQTTLEAFRDLDDDQREGVLEYLEELMLFDEVTVNGNRYVLVHAGIADYDENTELEDYQPEDFFSEPLDAAYALMEDATVIVGHVPTGSGKIERGEGSIFIDCGACEGGSLGCLRLEDGKEFYA